MEKNLELHRQITFVELIKHGLENGANVINGIPWSWKINGKSVTHENDNCYIIETLGGIKKFIRGNYLIAYEDGLKILVNHGVSILVLLFLFIFQCDLKSQIVYITKYKSDADKVVYVSSYKSDANFIVYDTKYKSEAKPINGIWYYTKYKSEAFWQIYYTKYKSEADIIVYYTQYKSEAGWR